MNRRPAAALVNTAIDLSPTAALTAGHPETLVFGMSQEETATQRARREREKQRRSFQEGYGAGIPVAVDAAVPAAPPAPSPALK